MIKKLILLSSLLLLSFGVIAQNVESNPLILKADKFYQGEFYRDASKAYLSALKSDKKNVYLMYRLSDCYYQQKKWSDALFYSGEVMMADKGYWLDAALIYASSASRMNEFKKAVRTYEKAIKRFPDNSTLYYNLGLAYFDNSLFQQAETYVQKAVLLDKGNSDSHLLLAHTMRNQGQWLKAMLPLYYFLIIEQDTERSKKIWNELQDVWRLAASNPIRTNEFNSGLSNEFAQLDKGLKSIAFDYLSKTDSAAQPLTFVNKTQDLFTLIGKKYVGGIGFYELTYLDLFRDIQTMNHTESFAYYLSNCNYNLQVLVWISSHTSEFQSFVSWMELHS